MAESKSPANMKHESMETPKLERKETLGKREISKKAWGRTMGGKR